VGNAVPVAKGIAPDGSLHDNRAMGRPKQFNREGVLDKAIALFWKHGFAETTLRDLERTTGVNKSGLYAEFKNKEDLFIASLRRYFELQNERSPLTIKPFGWDNIENFLKLSDGTWGNWAQKGCFSVNSMREFPDLPRDARELMIGNVRLISQQLVRNLRMARGKRSDNQAIADLIITFFCGISVEQNVDSTGEMIADKVTYFMRLIRAM
jgi:TetR/AcrR family transcriptional regulator, copper-responsive repressor